MDGQGVRRNPQQGSPKKELLGAYGYHLHGRGSPPSLAFRGLGVSGKRLYGLR